jgi:glucokinase
MGAIILAGDIGGTKTVLALYDANDSAATQGIALAEQTFTNSQFSGLSEIIASFLADQEKQPSHACFGIAGPVRANKVQMTNLDWVVDGSALAAQFGLEKVLLVNDLVATTAGTLVLPQEKFIPVNTGQADATGSIGVLALGTGLGQSFALPQNNQSGIHFQPFPTEGGHSSFAPRNQEQIELLQFLLRDAAKNSLPLHVSVEKVCSGMALSTLYAFQRTRCQEPKWMEEKRRTTQPAALNPLIVEAANAAVTGRPPCEPAIRAVKLLLDILADEAANLALKVLATGGIYLGGGMLPRLLTHLDPNCFMEIFCRGVYQEILADIPIHIITEPKAALFGACQLAMLAEKRTITC